MLCADASEHAISMQKIVNFRKKRLELKNSIPGLKLKLDSGAIFEDLDLKVEDSDLDLDSKAEDFGLELRAAELSAGMEDEPSLSLLDSSMSTGSTLSTALSSTADSAGDGASSVGDGIGLSGSGRVFLTSSRRLRRLLTRTPKFLYA